MFDGHLDYFHILAFVNCTEMNIRVQVFVWIPVFNFEGPSLGVDMLGYMVILCLFLRNCLLSTVAVAFYIPTNTVQEL